MIASLRSVEVKSQVVLAHGKAHMISGVTFALDCVRGSSLRKRGAGVPMGGVPPRGAVAPLAPPPPATADLIGRSSPTLSQSLSAPPSLLFYYE